MIRYFAGHPTAANLLMIAFLVLGLLALPSLQRETFPRISAKQVQVQVVFPSATAEDVLQAVCQPLEDALDGVDNLKEVICEARESQGVLTAEMRQGADLELFTADVRREVDAIDSLPQTAEEPIVSQLGRTDFVASLAITGPENPVDLEALARQIKDRMLAWGGIPKVEIEGFSDPQIRIEIDDQAARALGLSFADIAAALSRQNVDLPGGEIKAPAGNTVLRFTDERRTVDAYRSIVIASSASGGEIELGQIAQVTRQFEDEDRRITFDGRPAALLRITKTPQDDTLDVMAAVQAFLAVERAALPPTVQLNISNDGSDLVRDRLSLLSVNAAQGLALVFAAMWLFFGFRQAFWIAMGLPVSFMGALALMTVLDYSINMLTMVGLLIVIGILMDDAIVISENIATRRLAAETPLQAAISGAAEVGPGVFASFLTTAVVFGTLAFLEGDLGEVLGVVPVVMLLVLSVSLVEAFAILPNHLVHAGQGHQPSRATQQMERCIVWLRERLVGPLASLAVRFRYLTIGVGVFLLLSTIALMAGGVVKFVAFPDLDGDAAEARLQLRPGATAAQTEAVVEAVLSALRTVDEELSTAQPDAENLVQHITVRYGENVDANTTGAHLATIIVDLLSAETRTIDMDGFLAAWGAEVDSDLDLQRLNLTESVIGPAGRAIELRLRGPEIEALEAASAELQAWFAAYQGTRNLADDLDLGKPELRMTLREGAGSLGLDARMVADQLRAAFHGVTADEIQIGQDTVEIDVRLASIDRSSLGDLDTFAIVTPSGERVPLAAVANIETGRGYARISRIDRQTAVTVTGDVDVRVANANEIVSDTLNRFVPELLERYPGIQIGTEGQNSEAAQTQQSMMRGLLLGLVAVYLILAFQFRSYFEPLAVMSVIPFTLVGAVLGHLVMGIDFALPSMLGTIALAGVVVNGSILLVNVIKANHKPGETQLSTLAPDAAKRRFRAILLTSITTIAGVVPLMFESSLQAQILIPLVTSIAFGLIMVTLLLMLVVPAFYAVLHDFGLTSLKA